MSKNERKARAGIEIRPQVIEAGLSALYAAGLAEALELVPESEKRAIVTSVFSAMVQASAHDVGTTNEKVARSHNDSVQLNRRATK